MQKLQTPSKKDFIERVLDDTNTNISNNLLIEKMIASNKKSKVKIKDIQRKFFQIFKEEKW